MHIKKGFVKSKFRLQELRGHVVNTNKSGLTMTSDRPVHTANFRTGH